MFRDITTLLKDKEGLKDTVDIIYEKYKDKKIDLVAGVVARGVIPCGALGYKIHGGFVFIMKKGKISRQNAKHTNEALYLKKFI